MSFMPQQPSPAGLAPDPARVNVSSLPHRLLAVLLGTLLLTAGSWLSVPMVPVPMTMQTFAVTLVGAVLGARLGSLTVLAWLAEAALGLPVLAGGSGGLAPFMGPTAGYLFAFPLVAALVGALAERGWADGGWRCLGLMTLGNALILLLGAGWLAAVVGMPKAWAAGFVPFVLGGLLKSALAASTFAIVRRAVQRPDRNA